MYNFTADLNIIGVNPFVFVPQEILEPILNHPCNQKGKIPIRGTINQLPYQQTLVKYRGDWRLYINTTMLKNSPKRIGETLEITIEVDPTDRRLKLHPQLGEALQANPSAKAIFENLRPSLQHEIVRYITKLKNQESIDRNVDRAINFLLGNGRFVGRAKP
ncbi:YdeI/OmpD-associated family protein [Spirosoma horti]